MLLGVVEELERPLGHPRRRGLHGAWRYPYPSGGHVDEHHGEYLGHAKPAENPLGEEVALPKRLSMDLEEFVPSARTPLRPWLETIGLENIYDRLPGNAEDAQLVEFAENPGLAPTRLSGQLKDKLSSLFRGGWSATLLHWNLIGDRIDPFAERGIADNRKQMLQRRADGHA